MSYPKDYIYKWVQSASCGQLHQFGIFFSRVLGNKAVFGIFFPHPWEE